MATFGSMKGAQWWGEVSDLENRIAITQRQRAVYIKVFNGMQMQENPCPELVESTRIVAEIIATTEKRIESQKQDLHNVRNSYHD